MFLALIAIIFTLILVVGIHEAGHALAALYFKVKIKKISIGFGKPLLRWQTSSGCEWVWALLPLGGYVQLANTRVAPVDPGDYETCFDKKPIWQRIIILLAGAFANLLTAWIALIFVYNIGLGYTLPQIQSVQPESAAARAGFVAGDQFVSVGGEATPSWNDVGMQLVIYWGKKAVPIAVIHENSKEAQQLILDLSQSPVRAVKSNLLSQLGMEPNLTAPHAILQAPTLVGAINQANHLMVHLLYFFLMIFKQLFTGVIPFSMLLGPLSVFAASVVSLTQGIVVFLFFIATLSMAVATVNLFPIPGLDGGSIVYAVIEKIRGKPVSIALELLLHRLVFIIFCMVLVHLIMNDLQRL